MYGLRQRIMPIFTRKGWIAAYHTGTDAPVIGLGWEERCDKRYQHVHRCEHTVACYQQRIRDFLACALGSCSFSCAARSFTESLNVDDILDGLAERHMLYTFARQPLGDNDRARQPAEANET